MTQEIQSEEVIIRYLLHELGDQERELVEKRYFDDPNLLDQIDAVEADLMDKYALGLLSENERERFERYVLHSPSQRKKVEFAKELRDRIQQERQEESVPRRAAHSKTNPWWESLPSYFSVPKLNLGAAMVVWESLPSYFSVPKLNLGSAMVALVIIFGIGWLIVETIAVRRQLEQSRNEQVALERQRQELQARLDRQDENHKLTRDELKRVQDELDRLRAIQPQGSSPALSIPFLLAPTILKSGAGAQQKLELQGAGAIDMRLQLPPGVEDYPVYRATVETSTGVKIWSGKAQRVNGKSIVTAVVPANRFASQAYHLILQGKPASGEYEQVGIYPFTIVKK